ncbi:hypothetical protein AAHA92_22138 [Salvia divinorum]|uniref:PAP/OAS1 substrate-binding domain superfamily n=1 Tax=Salvia divinorum TaxID=28513 RepID=A0ABD1GMP3_SALDI
MGDLPVGGEAAEMNPMSSHSTLFTETNRLEIGSENWVAAERAAAEIIRKVQPTPVSEERRKNVVEYIQRLIRDCVGAEVFPYGSVPLKTYLPDGDIDLTAFGGANVEDTLADEMKYVLEEEEKNTDAEFVVKDVHLIRAEVKLVKCIVQDIVVDISFNQIGGLCTLCFLEQVDRLIGRDHLFKRSIILIKAWCYYESRILGAHHGLISTYALETLVLYIFHLYHSALDGPLAVLYKFLDYFSKFDWDTYCVSLNGVVRISSLPAFVVEIPEDSDKHLLLGNDFLNYCVSMFSVPSRVDDKTPRVFQKKHLNIVDPLKVINNLGRSVSKGNFYRIRSAFSYGARKLARILLQPEVSMANELKKFFANTMARHGGGQRPDIQDFDKLLVINRPVSVAPFPNAGFCRTDNVDQYMDEYSVSTADWQSSLRELSEDVPQGFERTLDRESREQNGGSLKESVVLLERDHGNLTTSAFEGLKISADACRCETPSAEVSANGSEDSDKCEKNASIIGSREEKVLADKGHSNHGETDQCHESMSGNAESLILTDLTGDYDCYIQHLQHGRWCYDSGLAIYGMQPILLPAVPFAWEDGQKHRGTGTYLPNMNMPPHGNRYPVMKVRSQAPSRYTRYHNGQNMAFQEPNMLDRGSHDLSHLLDKTVGASASSPDSYPPHQTGHLNANGSLIHQEGIEVELIGHPPPVSVNSRPQRAVSSSPRTPSGVHKMQTALNREEDRTALRSSYRLKDEDDFPPLST